MLMAEAFELRYDMWRWAMKERGIRRSGDANTHTTETVKTQYFQITHMPTDDRPMMRL